MSVEQQGIVAFAGKLLWPLRRTIRRFLRGSRVSALLARFDIDAAKFWLLMDLYDLLSERGEMLDQLGRSGVGLPEVSLLYAVLTGVMGIALVLSGLAPAMYLATFLGMTAFLLLTVLLWETGNSLVNPAEGLILAHQPINDATYTAAKLMHLGRIVLYLVPAINTIPALAGLWLSGSSWLYPGEHLAANLAIGVVAGLLCCALYGWLIRLVPARRLKAAGQLATSMPFLVFILFDKIKIVAGPTVHALPKDPKALGLVLTVFGAIVFAGVVVGIRSLSANYLIRMSDIMHGAVARRARSRQSLIGAVVAKVMGGQIARAGFAYFCKMGRRDYQFRRQAVPMLLMALVGWMPLVFHAWRADPFARTFTTAHLLPHISGILILFICTFMGYGSDFKSAGFFLLAPAQAFHGFARGIYTALALPLIVIPHAILLLIFGRSWGIWHAILFVAYSGVVSSIYLALDLRSVQGVPFTRQFDPARGAATMLMMILGALAVALAVGVQYFLVFYSWAIVACVTAALVPASLFFTRSSLQAFELSMRHNLGLLSMESGPFYKEIS